MPDANKSFATPAFYAEHGIEAMADVLITGAGEPCGVLEIDSPTTRGFNSAVQLAVLDTAR